jgi:hypothetical protein
VMTLEGKVDGFEAGIAAGMFGEYHFEFSTLNFELTIAHSGL